MSRARAEQRGGAAEPGTPTLSSFRRARRLRGGSRHRLREQLALSRPHVLTVDVRERRVRRSSRNARTFAESSRVVGWTMWMGSGGGSKSASTNEAPGLTASATWYESTPEPPLRATTAARDLLNRRA